MANIFKHAAAGLPGAGGKLTGPWSAKPLTRAQESEHRIKNHLQLIGSSLAIQARGCVHEESREILLQAYGRVSAVARLHERFQHMIDLRDIQVGDFLNEVCADLSICFNAAGTNPVTLEVDIQSKRMAAGDALTLGLIVNELVTNAVKHWRGQGTQQVEISLRREGNGWRLAVRDNGTGMSPDALAAGSSLGARLLHALAAQVGGVLLVDPVKQGASVSVVFRDR